MKLIPDYLTEPAHELSGDGLRCAAKRLLIGPADDSPLMALRIFTLEPGGHTPRHRHSWEHLN